MSKGKRIWIMERTLLRFARKAVDVLLKQRIHRCRRMMDFIQLLSVAELSKSN